MNTKKLLIYDTETTGINPRAKHNIVNKYFDEEKGHNVYEYGDQIIAQRDEILQLSMIEIEIDSNGKILETKEIMNQYFKPESITSWDAAERINHISPAMVSNCPTFKEKLYDVISILKNYNSVVGQNLNFDTKMVGVAIQEAAKSLGLTPESNEYNYGLSVENNQSHVIFDTMHEFANLRKVIGNYGNYTWYKLLQETEYYPKANLEDYIETKIPANSPVLKNGQIDFHNSLADVYMTGFVFGELLKENKNLLHRLNTVNETDPTTINNLYNAFSITPFKAKEICKTKDIDYIKKKMLYTKFPVDSEYLVFTDFSIKENEIQADMVELSNFGNPKAKIIRIYPFSPSKEEMFQVENKKTIYLEKEMER